MLPELHTRGSQNVSERGAATQIAYCRGGGSASTLERKKQGSSLHGQKSSPLRHDQPGEYVAEQIKLRTPTNLSGGRSKKIG